MDSEAVEKRAEIARPASAGLSARDVSLAAGRRQSVSERGAGRPAEVLHTVHDLDHRPMFWADGDDPGEWARGALAHATVAVGNRDEVAVAVGTREPDAAAEALLDLGVELAVVKRGPEGTLARTRDARVEVPPVPVDVVCGLGAGDAFGGALVHGLLHDWPLERTIRLANAAGAHVAGQLACADAMPKLHELEGALA